MIMQNISLFFTYETKLPADVGYSLYSPEHISAIAVSLLIIALIIVPRYCGIWIIQFLANLFYFCFP